MDTMFTKNLNWENVKAGEKVTIEIETEKAMVRDPGKLTGYCRSYSHGHFKVCLLFLGRRNWKNGGFCFLHTIDLHRFQLDG